MTHPLFAPDHKLEPYWLDDAPYPQLPEMTGGGETDVAIIGSGYTGLSAALTLAREGRGVIVFDAEDAGSGCSSRNGGQCGSGLKPGLDGLTKRFGKGRAVTMMKEALASLEFLADFVAREGIDCDFERHGRFTGAHKPGHYETLGRDYDTLRRDLGVDCQVVPRSEQHAEIGSDLYFGGGVMPHHAALHPAKLHRGLLERAQAAGANVAAHTPVTALEKHGAGWRLTTPRGVVTAGKVIVATNGYTDMYPPLAELRRRVIPIGSYMIATEPLEPGLMDRLMPRNRVLSDTRRVVLYYRASPDRRRILFGGRVALGETNTQISGPRLHAIMSRIFPETAKARITHSWMGFVAFTFDHLPHIGVHDGLHYAMGYCGTGVAWGTYMGHKVALQVLGKSEGRTNFDDLAFQTRPLYYGKPWFLSAAVSYYRLLDRFGP